MVFHNILLVLMSWGICSAVLFGLGSIVLNWVVQDFLLMDAFWIGIAFAVGFLQVWHLFQPVNLTADVTLLFLGSVGMLWNRLKLVKALRVAGRIRFLPLLFYGFVVLSLALRATGPCEHFDTGLYGATAVRWVTSYPVVPGLASLHAFLGFNSSVFLFVGALGQGIWGASGHHLFAGLMVCGFWVSIGPGIVRLLRSRSFSAADCFCSILLIPCTYWTTRAHLVGTMTDLPANVMCLVAVIMLFAQLTKKKTLRNHRHRHGRVVIAMSLLATAVTFKLSVAIFAFLFWLVCLFLLLQAGSPLIMVGSITFSAFLLAPWLIANVIMTGYPFYPQPVLGFNVDWRLSALECNYWLSWIRSWAREPWKSLAETAGIHWLGPWFHRNILSREGFQLPLVLTVGSGVWVLILSVKAESAKNRWTLLVLIPSMMSLLFWIFTAPAPRFAEAPLWIVAAVVSTVAMTPRECVPRPHWLPRLFGLTFILLAAWCVAPHRLWGYVYRPLLVSPKSLAMPTAEVIPTVTNFGLTIFLRADGQQCWDAPLPCTPKLDKTLRLRDRQNMRRGFNSDWPKNRLELEQLWEHRECSPSDAQCEFRRRNDENKDHGGE